MPLSRHSCVVDSRWVVGTSNWPRPQRYRALVSLKFNQSAPAWLAWHVLVLTTHLRHYESQKYNDGPRLAVRISFRVDEMCFSASFAEKAVMADVMEYGAGQQVRCFSGQGEGRRSVTDVSPSQNRMALSRRRATWEAQSSSNSSRCFSSLLSWARHSDAELLAVRCSKRASLRVTSKS